MKYLFSSLFLAPLLSFGQNAQTEQCMKLYQHYRNEKKSDSVVFVCQQLIKTDKRIAREHHLDYFMTLAAFDAKQTDLAVKQTKKILPYFYICGRTREAASKNIRYQHLSNKLATYYHDNENYRKEYYHLSRIKRRFNYMFCGNGRPAWENNLYTRMIEASEKLGKTNRAKRLEKELENKKNNRITTNF